MGDPTPPSSLHFDANANARNSLDDEVVAHCVVEDEMAAKAAARSVLLQVDGVLEAVLQDGLEADGALLHLLQRFRFLGQLQEGKGVRVCM